LGISLALASAALYGVVDFSGGILSRKVHYAFVAWVGHLGGLVLAFVLVLFVPAAHVGALDLTGAHCRVWEAPSPCSSSTADCPAEP